MAGAARLAAALLTEASYATALAQKRILFGGIPRQGKRLLQADPQGSWHEAAVPQVTGLFLAHPLRATAPSVRVEHKFAGSMRHQPPPGRQYRPARPGFRVTPLHCCRLRGRPAQRDRVGSCGECRLNEIPDVIGKRGHDGALHDNMPRCASRGETEWAGSQ